MDEKCALYLHVASRLTATTAQTTGAVHDFQTNALEVSRKAKGRVVDALKKWQQWKNDNGSWPTGELKDIYVSEILGGTSLVSGFVSLFPSPAMAAAGGISFATSGLSYLVPDKLNVMEALQAGTAYGIHQGFVNDLGTVDANMRKAIDAFQTEPPEDGSEFGSSSFKAFTTSVGDNRKDWSPPEVSL